MGCLCIWPEEREIEREGGQEGEEGKEVVRFLLLLKKEVFDSF